MLQLAVILKEALNMYSHINKPYIKVVIAHVRLVSIVVLFVINHITLLAAFIRGGGKRIQGIFASDSH